MDVLPEYMSVHHVHTLPVAAKRGCQKKGLKLWIVGCWGLNLGPLKEQLVL